MNLPFATPFVAMAITYPAGVGMLLSGPPEHSALARFFGLIAVVSMTVLIISIFLCDEQAPRKRTRESDTETPTPPPTPQGFSPDDVDQVLATMPDITPEARNAVHMLLKAQLYERKS